MALARAKGILEMDLSRLADDPKSLAKAMAEQRATLTAVLSAQVRINNQALRGKSSDRIDDILRRLEEDGWVDIYADPPAEAMVADLFS